MQQVFDNNCWSMDYIICKFVTQPGLVYQIYTLKWHTATYTNCCIHRHIRSSLKCSQLATPTLVENTFSNRGLLMRPNERDAAQSVFCIVIISIKVWCCCTVSGWVLCCYDVQQQSLMYKKVKYAHVLCELSFCQSKLVWQVSNSSCVFRLLGLWGLWLPSLGLGLSLGTLESQSRSWDTRVSVLVNKSVLNPSLP